MNFRRHSLLDINDNGRERILGELAGEGAVCDTFRQRCAQVILEKQAGARVPAIVRREECFRQAGLIPVGFSEPLCGNDGRLRLATFARPAEVVSTTSPYELLAGNIVPARNACTLALDAARCSARGLGLSIGVWGSAALELYTGLPCTHADSDLDLLVRVASRQVLSRFLESLAAIEIHFGLRIDVELDLPNGYGVHLKELFGSGRSVIGKSLTDVELFRREELLEELPKDGVSSLQKPRIATRRLYV